MTSFLFVIIVFLIFCFPILGCSSRGWLYPTYVWPETFCFLMSTSINELFPLFLLWARSLSSPQGGIFSLLKNPSLALLAHPPIWTPATSLVLEVNSRFFSVKNKRLIESSSAQEILFGPLRRKTFLANTKFFCSWSSISAQGMCGGLNKCNGK